MRSRVAIAIAKRERERHAAAAPVVTTTTKKKTTAKKATKSKKSGLADVTLASLDTEVADQVVAGDPKTMEEPKPE